jgi:enolase-phosphatase E1
MHTLQFNNIRAILLDIEGTTTPVDFVYKTLFPFARAEMKTFLDRSFDKPETRTDLVQLREEHAKDLANGFNPPQLSEETKEAAIESFTAYLHWLMDQDRKSTPLKSLQGKIWEEGYCAGKLRSQIFADVPRAMRRWRETGKLIAIYSSGSVLAQRLLFAHTASGDLTPLISNYFDTNTGGKKEAGSYARIATEFKISSSETLFISDVIAELEAARAAGMQTALSVRPGNAPLTTEPTHPVIHSFDEIN